MNSAESLLNHSTEKMEAAYSIATQKGAQDPIVLVLDVRDADAKWAATIVSDETQVEAALDHSTKTQTIPSLVTAVSRHNAEIIIERLDEGLAKWLKQSVTPDDQFIVICITDGRVACRASESHRKTANPLAPVQEFHCHLVNAKSSRIKGVFMVFVVFVNPSEKPEGDERVRRLNAMAGALDDQTNAYIRGFYQSSIVTCRRSIAIPRLFAASVFASRSNTDFDLPDYGTI